MSWRMLRGASGRIHTVLPGSGVYGFPESSAGSSAVNVEPFSHIKSSVVERCEPISLQPSSILEKAFGLVYVGVCVCVLCDLLEDLSVYLKVGSSLI